MVDEDGEELMYLNSPAVDGGRTDYVMQTAETARDSMDREGNDFRNTDLLEDMHSIRSLGSWRHRYPLKNTARAVFKGTSAFLAGLHGEGPTRQEAILDLGYKIHREFQTLRRIAPHERTPAEETAWRALTDVLDVAEWERNNPVDEPVIGRITKIVDRRNVQMLLNGVEDMTSSIDELPAEAAGTVEGDWFEGRLKRFPDGVKWLTWHWRAPLPDGAEIWAAFTDPGDETE